MIGRKGRDAPTQDTSEHGEDNEIALMVAQTEAAEAKLALRRETELAALERPAGAYRIRRAQEGYWVERWRIAEQGERWGGLHADTPYTRSEAYIKAWLAKHRTDQALSLFEPRIVWARMGADVAHQTHEAALDWLTLWLRPELAETAYDDQGKAVQA